MSKFMGGILAAVFYKSTQRANLSCALFLLAFASLFCAAA